MHVGWERQREASWRLQRRLQGAEGDGAGVCMRGRRVLRDGKKLAPFFLAFLREATGLSCLSQRGSQ